MNDFYVISYFTEGYEEDVKRLITSLEKYGLSFCIEKLEDRGSWINNANYKPTFILEKLKKLKTPVVWIDADGEIVRDPVLFKILNCDFAAHFRRRNTFTELLTGTLYINYSRKIFSIVQEWAEASIQWAASNVWEQKILQEIMERRLKDLRFYELPASYCCIFDAEDMQQEEPGIVMHYQASRRYRRKRIGE